MVGVGLWGVTVAFTLVLCTCVKSLTCFGLRRLDKDGQDTGVGGGRGRFVLDSKDLGPQLASSSATGKLLKIILGQLTPSGMFFICYLQIKLHNVTQI